MGRRLHKIVTLPLICLAVGLSVLFGDLQDGVLAAPKKAEKAGNLQNIEEKAGNYPDKTAGEDTAAKKEASSKEKYPPADNAPEKDSEAGDREAGGEAALAQILASDPMSEEAPDTTAPDIPATACRKYYQFETAQVLKGILATGSLYFNIPEYWDTRFVYLQLEYDVSRLIKEELPASLTILVNHIPVQSIHITYKEGKSQLAYVTIPLERINTGYNVLEVVSYVRIFDYEGCLEDQSQANWVTIGKESYIYAGYELKDSGHRISMYPYPFLSTADPSGKDTAILVSDKASDGELAAALYLMADISGETEETNEITLGRYSEAGAQAVKNKIGIFRTDNLPPALRKYLKNDLDNDSDPSLIDLSARAMLRFVDDEAGNPMLMIVADKEENLLEAVQLLLDENRRSQEKVSLAFAAENSAGKAYEEKLLSQLVAGSFTVQDLTGSGLTFIGPFHKEKILYLPFGRDYVLSSAGRISLSFRYSENLDFNRSLITVYWGEVPIASKRLAKDKASGDGLAFVVPADIVGTTAGSIKIAFDLEIPDMFCTLRQEEMPWAYVTGDSGFFLPAGENTGLSFDYFPSPFQTAGAFRDVLVITGDNPSDAELKLLGKTMALYGYQTAAYGSLKVIRAGEFEAEDADYNIITTGNARTNSFLKKINAALHFQYDEQGDTFLSNENLILSERYAQEIAAFQLLESPFAEGRAIFAVCIAGDDTSGQALSFLSDKTKRWELKGDCVLIDKELGVRSFQFIEGSGSDSKPAILQFIRQNKQPVLFTVMAAAAMLILLLCAVLVLIRSRSYKQREEEE